MGRSQKSRVLIVDDEVFFLEAIDEILGDAGYETCRAEDGEGALRLAQDPEVGVVVLDVRLPDMDGIQVLAHIREMRPELSIIMLSASTDQEIVLEALRLGASDYLAKPLHDEELVLAVGRAVGTYEANHDRLRMRGRIDRLVDAMERLSGLLRLAAPEDRVEVLRQGIVEAAARVLECERTSLMLADPERDWLSVVAARGAPVECGSMSPRKVGEGAAGIGFAEGRVLCVARASDDDRFAGRASGEYGSDAFAIVPLVCLGVPVGVLCLTEAAEDDALDPGEASLLRLLGMQVAEFLAADPAVERLLQAAVEVDVEGLAGFDRNELDRTPIDGDAELARAVCEAVAAEVEPQRVLRLALSAVSHHLGAAPVALYMLSPDGRSLEREAEVDGGLVGDRDGLPADRGLTGLVVRVGQLVATDQPEADGRFDASIDTPCDGLARPLLGVPIKLRNKVVGVCRAFLEEGRSASPRTAEVLSAAISAAVRNVLLYRSLLQTIEELAEARRQSRG
ncbi:MAG: response regulator [Myxococcales bacterium]|nr:response regulator [Myxococcales bacterium]